MTISTSFGLYLFISLKQKFMLKESPITFPNENQIILKRYHLPTTLHTNKKIEEFNNFRINVFTYDQDEEICPIYVSNREDQGAINLLLLEDENGNQYYIYIKKGHLTQHSGRTFYCYRCIHRFSQEDLLKDHLQYCRNHQIQAIKLPTEKQKDLKFTNIQMQCKKSCVIYADFEAILSPVSTVAPDPQISSTSKTAEHIPCSYAFLIVGPDGKSCNTIHVYRGKIQ